MLGECNGETDRAGWFVRSLAKSSIARDLARRTGAMWLRIDSMDQAIWASGTAPNDLLDWTYRAAQAVAADNLVLGLDVIADCVNDCEDAREGWEAAARKACSEIVWLEIVCSDATEHRHRVETRSSSPGCLCPVGTPSPAAPTLRGSAIISRSTPRIAVRRSAQRQAFRLLHKP